VKVEAGNGGAILGKPPALHLGQGGPFADGTPGASFHIVPVIVEIKQHVIPPLFYRSLANLFEPLD
jgi:hypothetical protein